MWQTNVGTAGKAISVPPSYIRHKEEWTYFEISKFLFEKDANI